MFFRRRLTPRTLVLAAVFACSGIARAADVRDPPLAEALFEEGKTLLEHGDYASACPKFAESFRLDPATGAVYALAVCHEREGKLATAWVEFIEAAARANAEHNAEREAAARARATDLEPRLSHLVVRVDGATAALPGLAVSYDGVTLKSAALGTSLPVDPGKHVVRAEAPGHRAWQTSVEIGSASERASLTVPALEALPLVVAPAVPAPTEKSAVLELHRCVWAASRSAPPASQVSASQWPPPFGRSRRKRAPATVVTRAAATQPLTTTASPLVKPEPGRPSAPLPEPRCSARAQCSSSSASRPRSPGLRARRRCSWGRISPRSGTNSESTARVQAGRSLD